MNRLCIETRGIGSWQDRLAKPSHWRRGYSAMEVAASWEGAAGRASGLPEPLELLFKDSPFSNPVLMVGIAEHKVRLAGQGGDSQCDVWALLNASQGVVSLSVEAKAKEPFGEKNESLARWLRAGKSLNSPKNRLRRWDDVMKNLPVAQDGVYFEIPFQLLHRCAAAVIEARHLRLQRAAFVVQAFGAPDQSFQAFAGMCAAMGLVAERGRMMFTTVGEVALGVGWADCPMATDRELASVV